MSRLGETPRPRPRTRTRHRPRDAGAGHLAEHLDDADERDASANSLLRQVTRTKTRTATRTGRPVLFGIPLQTTPERSGDCPAGLATWAGRATEIGRGRKPECLELREPPHGVCRARRSRFHRSRDRGSPGALARWKPRRPRAARLLRRPSDPAARDVARPAGSLRAGVAGAAQGDLADAQAARRATAPARAARAPDRRAARRPAHHVRLRIVPRRPGGDHPRRPRGARLRRHHADRRRQVADLPDPGAPAGRHHAGGVAAHRADEGPGRRGDRGRLARDLPELQPRSRRAAAAHRRSGRRRVRAVLRRARGDRGIGGGDAVAPRPAADRRRRSPLHQPVGARLSPGVPQPGRPQAPVRRRAGPGAHGDRDAGGHRRHHPAAGHGAARWRFAAASSAPTCTCTSTARAATAPTAAARCRASAKRSCAWCARATARAASSIACRANRSKRPPTS